MSVDSHLGNVPPVPKYSKELKTAVQDDKRRQEIDSAKKRAAYQNVDYESFAALVSMAHVKPFERKRGQQEESSRQVRTLPAWSFDASGSRLPLEGSQSTFNELKAGLSKQITRSEVPLLSETGNLTLKSKQEGDSLVAMRKLSLGCLEAKCMKADSFKREWRRLGTNFQEKLTFLLSLSPDELPKIFKVELPPSVLADMIEVLYWWKASLCRVRANESILSNANTDGEGAPTHILDDVSVGHASPLQSFDPHLAFHLLKSVRECGRFPLSLKLAGTRVLSLANQLIGGLMQCAEKNDMLGERLKGQSLCLHELKHLANVYS